MATNRRATKFYRKNEEEVMYSLGLIPTKNSGAGDIEKEDGQNEYLIAQLKSTDADSIRIRLHDIHKLEYNAIVSHKVPMFVAQFLKSDDLFIMCRPADLVSVAQYIKSGKCHITSPDVRILEEDSEEKNRKPSIKSSEKSRKQFREERRRRYEKG